MQAQSADGVIHDFPDDTDVSVISRVMKSYAQRSLPSPEVWPDEAQAAPPPSPQPAAPPTEEDRSLQPSVVAPPIPPKEPPPPGPSPEVWPSEDRRSFGTEAGQFLTTPQFSAPADPNAPPPHDAFSAVRRGFEVGKQAFDEAGKPTPDVAEQTLATPQVQAALNRIAENGGVRGYVAAFGSTALHDLALLKNGLLGAFQGSQEFLKQALTPVLGEQGARDLAAYPESIMGGRPHAPGISLTPGERSALRLPATTPPPGDLGVTARTPAEAAGYEARSAREANEADMARAAADQATRTAPEPMQLTGPESAPRRAPPAEPIDPVEQQVEAAQAQRAEPAAATEAPVESTPPALAAPAPRPERPAPVEPPAVIPLPGPQGATPTPTPVPTPALQPIQPVESLPPPSQPIADPPTTGSYVMLRPDQLQVDPQRFQFKESNERGVTGALEGTNRWETDLASPIMAWQDTSGQFWVADGHQRHDLATRAVAAGQEGVLMPARVYREADGYTPEHMRVLAAYKNIAEGSGTPIDAAKILRTKMSLPGDRALPTLPPRSQMVRQGNSLAKLSDEAFGVVVNGIVSPAYAAHVGDMITDPVEQMGALRALAEADPPNSEQARLIVKQVRDSGFAKGTQEGLFGPEDFAKSLIVERARVLDNAMRNLRRTKNVFKAAVEGEESLAAAGNQLDREGNVRAKTENEQLLDILERQATTRGPISDALNAAARDLAAGKPISGLTSQFLTATRGIVRRGEDQAVRPGDTPGGPGEAGEGPEPPVEGQGGFFGEEPRLTWEQMLARGEAVKRQAKAYAEAGKPVRFRDKYGITYVVSRDMDHPPDGWRVTMFGKDGQPSGHWEAKSAYDAFREVIAGRKERIGPNHPPETLSGELGEERPVPLFSAVERAAEGLKQAKGTGEQMLSQITKTAGVKPEEIKWMNLAEWLKGQKSVTKEQLLDYIRAHQLDVREINLSGSPFSDAELRDWGALSERYNRGEELSRDENLRLRNFESRNQYVNRETKTRYGSYTVPGGENYQELLITLPIRQLPYEVFDTRNGERVASYRTGEEARADAVSRGAHFDWGDIQDSPDVYTSSHWEPKNVLAHIRFNERIAPDGKRVLFVEEAQSDWHQAGRKRGYKVGEQPQGAGNFFDWGDKRGLSPQELETAWAERDSNPHAQQFFKESNEAIEARDRWNKSVPDAPFKTSWPALVMKRVLKYAVDNGFDRVAWAPGDVHAERYDLSRQVRSIAVYGKGNDLKLFATDHYNNTIAKAVPVTPSTLADHIGKEAAEKILSQPEPDAVTGYRKISGDDLKVGGSGMRGFYDKILPAETQKIVGKYGVKVSRSEIKADYEDRDQVKPDAQAIQAHQERWNRLNQRIAQIDRDLAALPLSQRYDDNDLVARGLFNARSEIEQQREILHHRMVDETMARGTTMAAHSVDISPAMRQAIQEQGMSLFQPPKAPLPPKTGMDLFGGQAKPPAAKPPQQFTIKNDPTQGQFPGMAPSAVQAQAAVNAAPPKGNQLPANEGLFAPAPPPPQPSLPMTAAPSAPPVPPAPPPAPAVSQWASHQSPGFTDKLHTVPDLNSGVEGASHWVLDMGYQTGHEHIAVIENATGRIVHAGTFSKKGSVGLAAPDLHLTPDTHTVVHNHPSGGPTSGADHSMLPIQGISDIVAIGHGGEFYAIRLGNHGRNGRTSHPGIIRGQQDEIMGDFDALRKDMIQAAAEQHHLGRISEDEFQMSWADMINRALHVMGVNEYMSSHDLFPPLRTFLQTYLRKNGFGAIATNDDRLALVTQPAVGIARIRSRASAGAGQGPLGSPGSAGQGPANVGGAGSQGSLFQPLRGELQAQAPFNFTGGGPNFDIVKGMTGLPRAMAEVKVALSPTSLRGAKAMEYPIRQHGAEAALAYQRAVVTLRKVRDATDRLNQADQLDFTDRMERGLPQRTPALNQVANTLRTVLDDWKQQIQSLGKGYLDQAIQDYMGHIWGNHAEWLAGQAAPHQSVMNARAQAAGQGRQPLRGSGNFLKQRTFDTQMEGIQAGLVPVTYNPIDMQLLKLREMQKFYYGTKLAEQMKANGIAVWVPEAQRRDAERAGYVKLDDRVFQPQLRGVSAIGPITPGAYYAIEPQARLFNRYMSTGISGQSIWYDLFRIAGNALNTLQLVWPGFHTSFVTADTANSRFALGLNQLANGVAHVDPKQMGRGMGGMAIGIGPGAVINTVFNSGRKLNRALLYPNSIAIDPEYRQRAQDFIMAGARMSMDQFYQNSASGSFMHAWKDVKNIPYQVAQIYRDTPPGWRKAIVPPIRIVARAMDTLMHPLMGFLVPRAKMGVFAENAREWHRQNPNATTEQRQAAMTTIWDNVEDRLGQMTYDNVFWHKLTKDIGFVSVRSVGWNLGTLRGGLGAVADAAQFAADIARLRKPEFTGRMAYGMTQFINQAIWGAILTYMFTGSGPQDWMDYFFPRTGGTTPDGHPERISIPGYVKDWIEYAIAPLGTLANKIHPLVSMAYQIRTNRDYYGGIIYSKEHDPSMAAAYADFILNSMLPFSWQGYNRLSAEEATTSAKVMSLLGFQPAPKAIVAPERADAFHARDDKSAYRRRVRETGRTYIFLPNPKSSPVQPADESANAREPAMQ